MRWELPKTVRRRAADSVCPEPPHPEERACGNAAANQVVRARVSKDGRRYPSCFETHRSAAERWTHSNSLGCDAPQHEGAGGRTNLRLQETIAGSVSLFPACSLQGMPQLQGVEPSARAPPRIVRRSCVARGSMSWRGVGGRETQPANFAMAGLSPRGDNAWAALGHATCHATRDEPCGSEVEG